MCYGCTLCNKCGKVDRMLEYAGKRCCVVCGKEITEKNIRNCPECGEPLPPDSSRPPGQ